MGQALAKRKYMKSLPLCNYEANKNIQTGQSKFMEGFHRSIKTIRALFGGNRTGKTESGGMEAVCAVLGEELKKYLPYMSEDSREIAERYIKIGAQDGWVCSVSFGLQPEGCQKKIENYLPKEEIENISYLRRVDNVIAKIILKNGKTITFKSYEQGAKDYQSAGIGWIWFDEEPPRNIWQEANMRQEASVILRIWITMTPVNGMTWVYNDIYLNKLKNPNIDKITVGWDDNPHLTEEQKSQMAAGLTDEEIQMRKDGKFVKKQGLVYKKFNQSIHVISSDWIPDKDRFTFYRSFDYGFAQDHPFVGLYFAVDTDGTVYCFNETYLRETGQEETVNMVKQTGQPFAYQGGWGDSARPDWIEYFNKNGLPTEKAIKDIEAGIAKVAEYLEVHPVSKKPKLFISARCANLIEELEQYAYPKKQDDSDRGKNLPEKRYDNGPDALRYFVASFYGSVKKPEHRTFGHSDDITGFGGTHRAFRRTE